MKLCEYEGKELFKKYNIAIPAGELIASADVETSLPLPLVVKAQTLSGKRRVGGGILFATDKSEFKKAKQKLFGSSVNGEMVVKVLVEEKIDVDQEFYLSFSYDTKTRGPVLAFSKRGGSSLADAMVVPINIQEGITQAVLESIFTKENVDQVDIPELGSVAECLWKLFSKEYALLAEINPLIKTPQNDFIAGDAKVILDDDKVRPSRRRFFDLGGDIAILASGGGASLLNIDALLQHGGRPANYTEYSGNPPAEVVKKLTEKVLLRPGLRGCWVVGGTANFTDIYETMRGFVSGLRAVRPKPTFPIVIRRDGPRQKEAFVMLSDLAKREGYQLYLFGSDTAMEESARVMVKLAYS